MKATKLNLTVLRRIAAGRREFANDITSADITHMRRCMTLGLVEVVDRATLRLTDAGAATLGL
jgi:hypothetical protein